MPSEAQASSTAEETPELQGDPMKDIIEAEARLVAEELGTVLDEEEGETGLDTEEQVSDDGKNKSQTIGKTSQERPPGTPEKRLGTDEILKAADSSNDPTMKEAARVIRSMQTTVGRTQTAWKQQQAEFKQLAQTVSELKAQLVKGEEPNPNDPLLQIPRDQIELFQRLADRLGYVKADAIDDRETERNTISFKQESAKRGMEKWGDKFGYVDETGQFHFAEDTSDKVASVYERFYDPKKGVTPEDLFVLGNLDDILKDAEGKGREAALKEIEEQNKNGQSRIRMVKRGITESRSTGGKTSDVIYKGFGKDTVDDVVARAMRAAMRELPTT